MSIIWMDPLQDAEVGCNTVSQVIRFDHWLQNIILNITNVNGE